MELIAEFHFCFEGCGAFGQLHRCTNCGASVCGECYGVHLEGEAQATVDEAATTRRRGVYGQETEKEGIEPLPLHSWNGAALEPNFINSPEADTRGSNLHRRPSRGVPSSGAEQLGRNP